MLAKKLTGRWFSTGIVYRVFALIWLDAFEANDEFSKEVHYHLNNNNQLDAKIKIISDYLVKYLVIENHFVKYDGKDITDKIACEQVAKTASLMAANLSVRNSLFYIQRLQVKKLKSLNVSAIFVDGRDSGSVVFKDANLKFFLTSDVKIRARRRFLQLYHKTPNNDELEKMAKSIAKRDARDISRKHSPLTRAMDAIEINSSNHTDIEHTVNVLLGYIEKHLHKWW